MDACITVTTFSCFNPPQNATSISQDTQDIAMLNYMSIEACRKLLIVLCVYILLVGFKVNTNMYTIHLLLQILILIAV